MPPSTRRPCPVSASSADELPELKGPAVKLSSSGLVLARTPCGRVAVLEETGELIGGQPILRIVSLSDEAES